MLVVSHKYSTKQFTSAKMFSMAKAESTFGSIVGAYFNDTILPHLELRSEDEINEERNQYIADATTKPSLVEEIEGHYGVSIW